MAIYYILLFTSALIFSLQFLITRLYQGRNGSSFLSSIWLSIFAYLIVSIFFLVKGSITLKTFNFGFSWFTFVITLFVALVSLLNVFMGIKVISVGDMSIYSVFMMLGSLILPSLVGIVFYKEEITLIKCTALVLMLLAIIFSISSVDKGKFTKKAFLYYLGIFFMNGMIGVLFTIHQNHPTLTALPLIADNGEMQINNDLFMTWNGLSTVILCGIVYIANIVYSYVTKQGAVKIVHAKGKETYLIAFLIVFSFAGIYGVCNGVGDYFIAIATQPGALGSSVTFPIINGGTILFSTIIGIVVFKEKAKLTTWLSVVLVIIATILFMYV